jgi:MYXO-CTERM domain-containing protein
MFLKSMKLGLAAAVVGMLAASAKAAVVISLSITATPDPVDNLTPGITGQWKAYAQITEGAAETGGINTLALNVVPTGGISIVDIQDGSVMDNYTGMSAQTQMDVPGGAVTTGKNGGFLLLNTAGLNGMGLAAAQNPTSVTSWLVGGVRYYSVLAGIGKTAGSTPAGLAWDVPFLIAEGYYYDNGKGGTLEAQQTSDGASGWLMLPTTIAAGSIAGNCFTPSQVVNGSVTVGSSTPDTPEPASLGVLALGGLALLARRRKVA